MLYAKQTQPLIRHLRNHLLRKVTVSLGTGEVNCRANVIPGSLSYAAYQMTHWS